MLIRVLRVLALMLVSVVAYAPAASAATANIVFAVSGELQVVDTDGGSHDVAVSKTGANAWLISDMAANAHLTPVGPALFGCDDVVDGDDSAYTCTSPSITKLLVDMGDGADKVNVATAGVQTTILGGPGNDNIRGSDFIDVLNGNASDLIDGGGGNDFIDGAAGDDILMGANGADSLYGGSGDDQLNSVDAATDTANSCDLSPAEGMPTPGLADIIDMDSVGDTQDGSCEQEQKHAASAVPSNTVAPASPSGSVVVGGTLTSTQGTWTGDQPITITQQWQRCDASGCYFIAGATSLSYVLTTADIGYQLRLKVFATNAAGPGTPVASPMSAKLAAPQPAPQPPSVAVAPAAPTGTVKVGSRLTSSFGQWKGTAPITTKGFWQRCTKNGCFNIAGANTNTYTVNDSSDVLNQLRFKVVATNSAGSAEAFSSKTIPVPKPVVIAPVPVPAAASGSNCDPNEKATKVGSLFICYRSSTFVQAGIWNLTGPVTINRAFFVADSAIVQIDQSRKLIIAQGANLKFGLVKPNGDWARVFTATDVNISNPGDTFRVDMWNAKLPDPYTSGGLPHTIIDASGYYADGPSQLQVSASQSGRKFTWTSGVRLMGGALSVTGPVTYDYTGALTTDFRGCLTGTLPVEASNIVEVTNPCVEYDPSIRQWKLTASAKVLNGTFSARANAGLVNGQLDNVAVDVSTTGQVPFVFGSYLNQGGINIGGFQTGVPTFGGNVGGGWPLGSSSTAEITIVGDIQYVGGSSPKLTINGSGTVYVGGQEIANAWANLSLVFNSNLAPRSVKVRTHVNALGGFIEGDASVNISGDGFFAETTARVGFPSGADITNTVNYRIREFTRCHWVPNVTIGGTTYTACPQVDGWSADMKVVVSSKGAGAKGGIGSDPKWRVSATTWWSTNNGWGVDVAWSDSKNLDFLKRVTDKYGGVVVAEVSSDTFVVEPGTQFIALQLDGSTTGNVIVRDPKGSVIADTATGTYVADVGFGRDPAGGPAAVLMIPKTVVRPGTWTVIRSGDAPFTAIRPVAALDEAPEAKLTKVAPVGGPATRLTAGSSKVLLTWKGPKGARVGLRARTPDGITSMPIRSGLASSGSFTWRVPIEWAGPLQIEAVTERDGVSVSTAPFPTVFTVIRPLVAAPRAPRVTRLRRGAVNTSWNAVPGARKYQVEVRIKGVRKPILYGSSKAALKLDLDARGMVRVRVRGLSSLGIPGKWSAVGLLAQAPKPKPVRRPVRRPARR